MLKRACKPATQLSFGVMHKKGIIMMKSWPTEKQKNNQLLVAVFITVGAVLDGIVLVGSFSSVNVLCEILLVSFAVLQWCIYFDIRTKLDIKAILENQEDNNSEVHNKPDAGDGK